MAHIVRYGSQHTESIDEDKAAAERFLAEVDSAIVMLNAWTQFADGAEFGMGAEIGIATAASARGPVGAEQLTIFKYVVRGTGRSPLVLALTFTSLAHFEARYLHALVAPQGCRISALSLASI
jgi:hypothetical protein